MRQPPAVAPRDASFRGMVSATMPERDPVAGHPPHGSGSAGTPLRICYVFQDELVRFDEMPMNDLLYFRVNRCPTPL